MKRALLVSLSALVWLAPARGQTPEEKKATVEFMQKLQSNTGGFLPAPAAPTDAKAPTPTVRATSSALRALKYFGGEARDRAAAAKFVENCFDKTSGGFADTPGGKPDVFTTAVGLMAMMELKLPTEPYVGPGVKFLTENAKNFEEVRIGAAGLETVNQRPKQADAWLEQVVKTANADGTYGKGPGAARATGGAVAAVLRLGGKLDQQGNVVKILKTGQRPDGGFGKEEEQGSDLETSYRVMRAFHMLKEKP
ncbi:MAG: terpene cyclase/mutase family protein, partial [Planctomycetia bacterium]|nr:terpene cyclase/mutase family protein [Planctomycetia bacterium]